MPREIVYAGHRIQVALEILSERPRVTKEVVLHPGAVAILPLLGGDRVVLIRNRRISVAETLLEIPAGTLEPPEEPAAAARRELAEETGYSVGKLRKIAEFFPSPGVLSERMHLFVAQDLRPGPMAPEADEELQPLILPWTEALSRAMDGTIRDAKTLVALLLWDRLQHAQQHDS